MVSKAQMQAVSRYEAKNYDKVLLRMPKGRREEIKAAAEAEGMSLNAYIMAAINEKIRSE